MFGRDRPPAAVKALLEGEERVLAWGVVQGVGSPAAVDASDAPEERGYVVATNLGLWWPEDPPRRIAWHLIVRATWSERGLTVVEADVEDGLLLVERPARVLVLAREGKIPPVVRRRVEGSIDATHDVRLDEGPARVVSRRVPGQDGRLWLARLGPQTPDTDLARDQLRALVQRFENEDAARRDALLR